MAPLKQYGLPLIYLLVANPSLAQEGKPVGLRLPQNVFEQSPYSRKYHNWWRPYRTIFDRGTVSGIQRQLDAFATSEARYGKLPRWLANRTTSSFLYPVLAANGPKGRVILERFLSEYANGASLDDRWLLIIAALGRNPSEETQEILQNEFDRVLREYEFPPVSPANPIPTADARLPVADALLACMAAQQLLTAEAIERLTTRLHGTPQNELLWMIGVEWAQALMPEEKVLDILEDGFGGCADSELDDAMNLAIEQPGRITILRSVASSSRNAWPLTRSLLVKDVKRRKVLSDFIGVLYSLALVNQADDNDGLYDIDDQVIEAMSASQITPCRFLARNCWVLKRCRASIGSRRWEAFLDEHATHLDERDRRGAKSMLARILGPKTPETTNVYDPSRPFGNITKPDVYLMGFRRAGGRLPEKSGIHHGVSADR